MVHALHVSYIHGGLRYLAIYLTYWSVAVLSLQIKSHTLLLGDHLEKEMFLAVH